ncbi:MAG TPA: hypothetical protein VJQ60_11930 [Arthrobacter sp.]|nr:hypothetical protein [Arthrobacter sp.]
MSAHHRREHDHPASRSLLTVGLDRSRVDVRLVPSAMFTWTVSAVSAFLPASWSMVLSVSMGLAAGVLLFVQRKLVVRGGAVFQRGVLSDQGKSRKSLQDGFSRIPRSRRRTLPATFAMACLMAASVAAHAAADSRPREHGAVAKAVESRGPVVIHAIITGEPRELAPDSPGPGRWAVEAEIIDLAANGMLNRSRTKILVTGGDGWGQVVPGQVIRTAGKLKPAWPGQVEAGVLAASTGPLPPDLQRRHEAEQDNPVNPAWLKEQFSAAAQWLSGDAAGLMPGMVTGDTSRLDESLETAMKTTGTTHLNAVSGETVIKVYGSILGT